MGPKNSGCSRSRTSSSGNSHRQTGSFWKPVDNIVMIASASVSSARTIFAGCDCMLSPPVKTKFCRHGRQFVRAPRMLRGGLVRAVSGIAADADTVLVSVAGQLANGSADVTLAMPHGRLRDDIHA